MRLEPRESRDGRHGKQTTSQRRPTRKGEHPCRRPPARPGMASAAVHADLRSTGREGNIESVWHCRVNKFRAVPSHLLTGSGDEGAAAAWKGQAPQNSRRAELCVHAPWRRHAPWLNRLSNECACSFGAEVFTQHTTNHLQDDGTVKYVGKRVRKRHGCIIYILVRTKHQENLPLEHIPLLLACSPAWRLGPSLHPADFVHLSRA